MVLSDTLATGLDQYRIGAKIRALRAKKSLGLVQLGSHTGLSPSMISKIERGQLIPTLPTLLRIALVFGVGLDHFFGGQDDRPALAVVRKKDRMQLPDRPGASPSYLFESLDYPLTGRTMEAFLAEFPAQAPTSAPHRHPGSEFIFVLKGELTVSVDGHDELLHEGDAMSFDCSVPHTYQHGGQAGCRALVVVSAGESPRVPAATP